MKERVFDEHRAKEISVAERFWLDASLFPLRLVNLVESSLQLRFMRQRENKRLDEDRRYWSSVNSDEQRACALGCKYSVNVEWSGSFGWNSRMCQ